MTGQLFMIFRLHPTELSEIGWLFEKPSPFYWTLEHNLLTQRLSTAPVATNNEWSRLYYFYSSAQGQSHFSCLLTLHFYEPTWMNWEWILNLCMLHWSPEWQLQYRLLWAYLSSFSPTKLSQWPQKIYFFRIKCIILFRVLFCYCRKRFAHLGLLPQMSFISLYFCDMAGLAFIS